MRMVLIIGGSGSGKSAFAESYLLHHAKDGERYYLATMKIYGEEGRKKVERHRKMREGKGFLTIEQPNNLEAILPNIREDSAVLLECMSNLTANEMFSETGILSGKETVRRVLCEIEQLKRRSGLLVIVTNNVFEDGICYEQETMEYNRALANINCHLAKQADTVVEVLAGIPNLWKGCGISDDAM